MDSNTNKDSSEVINNTQRSGDPKQSSELQHQKTGDQPHQQVKTNELPPTPHSTKSQNRPVSEMNQSGSDFQSKIKGLEAKVAYYEKEHNDFQNKLLNQRASYEDDIKNLKRRIELIQNVDTAKQYSLELFDKCEMKTMQEKVSDLLTENESLKKENERLELEISNNMMQYQTIEAKADDNIMADSPKRIVLEDSQQEKRQGSHQGLHFTQLDIDFEIILNEVKPASRGATPSGTEETYQDKLQKLQKKITDFETYLEEKDKTLLEQENNLNELQDQLHEHIKGEDQLRGQVKERTVKIDELIRELKLLKESYEYKIQDLQHQLQAKDGSLSDAWQMASEKELEIQKLLVQLREGEDAVNNMRNDMQSYQEDHAMMQQRLQENNEEMGSIKQDFQQILNFKNELETLIEEQTSHIEMKNKKLHMLEETLRFKESELEKKESILRRISTGADEMKKKLASAEMKLRQITQTTLRDLKSKLKDQVNEIEVLKEMVKSSNKQAKAKDIDIQRLSKKIQRLEKLTEINKGLLPTPGEAQQYEQMNPNVIEEENENLETDAGLYTTPLKQPMNQNYRNDPLGLNPANYSVEDEVQMEILQAQQNRLYNLKSSVKKGVPPQNYQQNFRNSKQREIEEAMELDRMLEQERRNQSQDIFQKKYDEKFDQHYNNISIPNYKNTSIGMRGIFGGGGGQGNSSLDESSYKFGGDTSVGRGGYDGMLPNLNVSKRECNLYNLNQFNCVLELEQELMNDINNESMKKADKFMTPNLHGKQKQINKLGAAAYPSKQGNAPYFHERNKVNSKKL